MSHADKRRIVSHVAADVRISGRAISGDLDNCPAAVTRGLSMDEKNFLQGER